MNPYFKLQRAFVRQTIALGGDALKLDAGINQLRATTTANRLVITAGKMGVGDIFDTNRFAHDPRGDFLNWSLVDTGSFDYAANAWGYTYGIAAEWYQGPWTLRVGLYNLSKVPNGIELESNFSQNAVMVEGERRFRIAGHDGTVRVTGFRNRGQFARFDDALVLARSTGLAPDLVTVRRKQDRFGIALNAEQDVTDTLGVFLRAGTSDGAIETYDFTDIDRSLAFGGALKGKAWGAAGHAGHRRRGQRHFRCAQALAGRWRHGRFGGRWRFAPSGRRTDHRGLLCLSTRRLGLADLRLSTHRQPWLQQGSRPS
jgi:high affinity Mn2+ porin